MTSPKGHVPHSQRPRAKKTTLADKHLTVKERLKFVRAGAYDPTINASFSGEGVYGSLNKGSFVLWPVAISPHSK